MTTPPLWSPVSQRRVEQMRSRGRRMQPNREPLVLRLLQWPATRPERSRSQTAVGVAVLVALLRFPTFVDGEWATLFAHVRASGFVLGWMLLLSTVTRTTTPREILAAWLSGVFVAGAAVDGLGALLEDSFSPNLFTSGVVPVLEESFKLAPMLIFVFVSTRRRRGYGAFDLALLGAATGGGFAMYEDMLWGRRFLAGIDGGWSNLVPTVLKDPLFVAGHLAWSAAIACGVGLLIVHRRAMISWVAGPLLIAVPTLDHAAINFRGEQYASMRDALQDGRLAVMLLFVGVALTLALDNGVVRRSRQGDHLFQPRRFSELVTAPAPMWCSTETSPRQFQRARNSVVFRAYGGIPPTAKDAVSLAEIEESLKTRPTSSAEIEASTAPAAAPGETLVVATQAASPTSQT